MDKKVNYPSKRKPAEKVYCPLCGKLCAARGVEAHLRMGHYQEIADFYSFLQEFYTSGTPTEEGDPSTEIKVSYLIKERKAGVPNNKAETVLAQLVKLLSEGNFKLENIPPDLKQIMKEFGWKEKQATALKITKSPLLVDLRNFISESDPPRLVMLYPNGIKEITFNEYEELLRLQAILEMKIENFRERVERYKGNPALFTIERAHMRKDWARTEKDIESPLQAFHYKK